MVEKEMMEGLLFRQETHFIQKVRLGASQVSFLVRSTKI